MSEMKGQRVSSLLSGLLERQTPVVKERLCVCSDLCFLEDKKMNKASDASSQTRCEHRNISCPSFYCYTCLKKAMNNRDLIEAKNKSRQSCVCLRLKLDYFSRSLLNNLTGDAINYLNSAVFYNIHLWSWIEAQAVYFYIGMSLHVMNIFMRNVKISFGSKFLS